MKLSQVEQAAIRRLQSGARILRSYYNETSLQKWVALGIAKWADARQWSVVKV